MKLADRTICFVGHGPTLTGKGLGNEIDSHDIVVRMVDCGWENPADYGDKHTILIYCPSQPHLLRYRVVPSSHYFLYRPRETNPCNDAGYIGDMDETPCYANDKMLRSIWISKNTTPLSRGSAAIILSLWFYETTGLFDHATLYGFSKINPNTRSLSVPHHPTLRKQSGVPDGKEGRHSWSIEQGIIDEQFSAYNVPYEYKG